MIPAPTRTQRGIEAAPPIPGCGAFAMPGWAGDSERPRDRAMLLRLQGLALSYFVDNQTPGGLVPDRQSNHGPALEPGLCSISATGMGLISVALASASPYRLIGRVEAIARVESALRTVLEKVPHDHGILPHFVDVRSNRPKGEDTF